MLQLAAETGGAIETGLNPWGLLFTSLNSSDMWCLHVSQVTLPGHLKFTSIFFW